MKRHEIRLDRIIENKLMPDDSRADVYLFVKGGVYFGLTKDEMIQMRDLLNSTLFRCAVDYPLE